MTFDYTSNLRYEHPLYQRAIPLLTALFAANTPDAEVYRRLAIEVASASIPSYLTDAIASDLFPLAKALVQYGDRASDLDPLFPAWMSETERNFLKYEYIRHIGTYPNEFPPGGTILKLIEGAKTSDIVRRGLAEKLPGLWAGEVYTLNYFLNKRTRPVYDASRLFVKAIDSVPWPHPWMKDFVLDVDINYPHGGPLMGDTPIWDFQALLDAGFFRLGRARLETELAKWLVKNADTLDLYFQKRAEYWVGQQESKAKEGLLPAFMSFVGGVLQIGGMVAGMFLPAVGQVLAAAASGGFQIGKAYLTGQQQLETFNAAKQALGISPAKVQEFSDWIRTRAAAPVDGFVVTVEGRKLPAVPNADQAGRVAVDQSSVGDRVGIQNASTGDLALYLRTAYDLMRVPPEKEKEIRQMPHDILVAKVKAATSKARGDVPGTLPPWLLLVPVLLGKA